MKFITFKIVSHCKYNFHSEKISGNGGYKLTQNNCCNLLLPIPPLSLCLLKDKRMRLTQKRGVFRSPQVLVMPRMTVRVCYCAICLSVCLSQRLTLKSLYHCSVRFFFSFLAQFPFFVFGSKDFWFKGFQNLYRIGIFSHGLKVRNNNTKTKGVGFKTPRFTGSKQWQDYAVYYALSSCINLSVCVCVCVCVCLCVCESESESVCVFVYSFLPLQEIRNFCPSKVS